MYWDDYCGNRRPCIGNLPTDRKWLYHARTPRLGSCVRGSRQQHRGSSSKRVEALIDRMTASDLKLAANCRMPESSRRHCESDRVKEFTQHSAINLAAQRTPVATAATVRTKF